MISYIIVTLNALLSKSGDTLTSIKSTLGSKLIIDCLISSLILSAEISSMFSKESNKVETQNQD